MSPGRQETKNTTTSREPSQTFKVYYFLKEELKLLAIELVVVELDNSQARELIFSKFTWHEVSYLGANNFSISI